MSGGQASFPLQEGPLAHACASSKWVAAVRAYEGRVHDLKELVSAARQVWWNECTVADWLEAFAAHPRVGNVDDLKKKHGAFGDSSRGEQAAAMQSGSDAVFEELAAWNEKYEAKFGHIFIICASGKTAGEMLEAVKSRYPNTPHAEVAIAAAEQMKITELRLAKSFGARPEASNRLETAERRTAPGGRSPITTHILDTSLGKPAAGVEIALLRRIDGSPDQWTRLGAGLTNDDGRVTDLLPPGSLEPGTYCMQFETAAYLATNGPSGMEVPFYPCARVEFEITASQLSQHFHIPLLLNPFGYSTYRGS